MEKKLIFLHIPKCAGTTFHRILQRVYREERSFVLENVGGHRTYEEFQHLSDRDLHELSIVRGHLEYGFHKELPGNWRYLTFLRDPVERVKSFYTYASNSSYHELYGWIRSEEVSFERFVVETKRHDVHEVAVRWLSGISASPEEMLQRALENIERDFPVVGIVERFDESLVLMQRRFGWPTPYYEIENRSKQIFDFEISKKARSEIHKRNAADTELYRLVNKRLTKQLSSEPYLSSMLDLQKLKTRNLLSRYPGILKIYHRIKTA